MTFEAAPSFRRHQSRVHRLTQASTRQHRKSHHSNLVSFLNFSPNRLLGDRTRVPYVLKRRYKMEHVVPRAMIALSVLIYITAIVINALAGAGRAPFHNSTGNVSKRYETDITPAGWTFSIWGLIYTWLTGMVLYLASLVCRKGNWSLFLLPCGFYISWIFNMTLNMLWLLLWDRELMEAALVVLALLVLTNCCMVGFCSYAVDLYGAWLRLEHPKDLLCLRLIVQNGLALYTTWTSIATLINFSLVLNLMDVNKNTAATASLCVLLVLLLGWFILENFVIERSVRYVLTIYPVVVIALLGILAKHYAPAQPSPNDIFTVVLLVLAVVMLMVRVAMVIWRSRKQPLFAGRSTEQLMSPMMSPATTFK